MVVTTTVKKIEILVDAPLLRRIRRIADDNGVSGYTLYPTVGGDGGQGRWDGEQVTGGAGSKVLFASVLDVGKADIFLSALEPLLDEYGLMITLSNVEVIRAERF